MKNSKPLKILFLVSGSGGSLKFVHQAIATLQLPLEIVAVVGDRDCGALDYAASVGLAYHKIAYSRKNPQALQQLIRGAEVDAIVTNIHKIIDADTLNIVPGGYVNLHYSLLPAFKGLIGMETVEQARQLNVTIIGATCHEVDEQVDNGQCIAQFAVNVNWQTDAIADVYDIVFRGASLILLQGLLQRVEIDPIERPSVDTLLMRDKTMLFAPALRFDAQSLQEEFWQQLKNS